MVGDLPQGWVRPDALLPLGGAATRAVWQRHGSLVLLAAAALALIDSMESIFSAIAVDQLTGRKHDSRRELISLGAANIASGLCGGMPLSLGRLRAAQLIDSGAAARRPAVVAVVCAVTAADGFVAGLSAGVLLSMLIFVCSVNRSMLRDRYNANQRPSRRIYRPEYEAVLRGARCRVPVFELQGALLFGSAARLTSECETLTSDCRCLVLDLRRVSTIDESDAMALQQLSNQLKLRGVMLLLAGVVAGNRHGQRLRDFGCFRRASRPKGGSSTWQCTLAG